MHVLVTDESERSKYMPGYEPGFMTKQHPQRAAGMKQHTCSVWRSCWAIELIGSLCLLLLLPTADRHTCTAVSVTAWLNAVSCCAWLCNKACKLASTVANGVLALPLTGTLSLLAMLR